MIVISIQAKLIIIVFLLRRESDKGWWVFSLVWPDPLPTAERIHVLRADDVIQMMATHRTPIHWNHGTRIHYIQILELWNSYPLQVLVNYIRN